MIELVIGETNVNLLLFVVVFVVIVVIYRIYALLLVMDFLFFK